MSDRKTAGLAPVVVFAYNRPDNLKKCLDSLAENAEARETDLYLFCDGVKPGKDPEKIMETQAIASREAEGQRFASVRVTLAEQNRGLAKSVISGVTEIINLAGRCIVVEDDLIVAREFLQFMNGALDYYAGDKQIWSISGFTYPFRSLEKYPHDVYLSYRMCSWGWGIWADRWNTVDWNVGDYRELFYKPWRWIRFNRGGNDLFRMLRRQMQGKRDSWAIRACYAQSRQNRYTVYPTKPLIKNIGFDGQGTHSEPDPRFEKLGLMNESRNFTYEKIGFDRKIVREFKSLFRVTFPEAIDSLRGKLKRALGR